MKVRRKGLCHLISWPSSAQSSPGTPTKQTSPTARHWTSRSAWSCPRYSGGRRFGLPTTLFRSLAVGDVCFVGVPGELCAELGQEIKWHSPFRRTFIAYNSTAYISYMGPANFLVQGGYEAASQRLTASGGLTLLNTAANALTGLREQLFPSDGTYPDANPAPLVNLPANR